MSVKTHGCRQPGTSPSRLHSLQESQGTRSALASRPGHLPDGYKGTQEQYVFHAQESDRIDVLELAACCVFACVQPRASEINGYSKPTIGVIIKLR